MLVDCEVPIVIVGFGNADEVITCLSALGAQRNAPRFGVFICENGGSAAFDVLVAALSGPDGPCEGAAETLPPVGPQFVRTLRYRLRGANAPMLVSEARANFGFAGGINTWVRLFLPAGLPEGRNMVDVDTESRH